MNQTLSALIRTKTTQDSKEPGQSVAKGDYHTKPLSKDDAKQALERFAREKFSFEKRFLKHVEITELKPSSTYRYILETFTEKRTTFYVHEAFIEYDGKHILREYMSPPSPWDIQVKPKKLFSDETIVVEVPDTAIIEDCLACSALGDIKCCECDGKGRTQCVNCLGSGRDISQNRKTHCNECSGGGSIKCNNCNEQGKVPCISCQRYGKLKWYFQLKVEFRTQSDDLMIRSANLPPQSIRESLSENIFTEQSEKAKPISKKINPAIHQASSKLINSHLIKFSECRILAQRHFVDQIPVTECRYTWKNKSHSFIVYGLDNQVHCSEYPSKYAQCCPIT